MKDFEIQNSYNKLKYVLLELNIPILAISTLNSQVSKDPTLIADLKIHSMDKSDVIIYMYKPTDELMNSIVDALNKFRLDLAKKQIKIAFDQVEEEVKDLQQRISEGIATAKLNRKQIGQAKGLSL